MLKSVEGIYRDGKVELLETPPDIRETRVIETFLPERGTIDLRTQGVDEAQAAQLRWRLQASAEDWERPEMDVYDDLFSAKADRETADLTKTTIVRGCD